MCAVQVKGGHKFPVRAAEDEQQEYGETTLPLILRELRKTSKYGRPAQAGTTGFLEVGTNEDQHWRGPTDTFGREGAPVLEFRSAHRFFLPVFRLYRCDASADSQMS